MTTIKRFYAITDSIFNSEKSLQINELRTKYEAEKNQQRFSFLTTENALSKLSLQEKRRELLTYIFAIILLIVVTVLIIYVMSVRSKMKRQLLSSEIESLNTQVSSLVEGTADGLDITLEDLNKRATNALTDREYEILMLAVSGQSNAEMADQLCVSVNTIKYHLKKYTKSSV